MHTVLAILITAALAASTAHGQEKKPPMLDVKLMTLDPGHFHAALIQKEMYPGVDPTVHVYAPTGNDLQMHLKRVEAFNTRAERPTAWQTVVYEGSDFLERMLKDHRGTVVILSGRNRGKIDRIAASVNAGLHVLADKPWILQPEELAKVEVTLAQADTKRLVAYDIMTERFEITSILQRALVNDPATFGELVKGTEKDPSVYMESVHHLMKTVAGAPNIRPAWFFDTSEQGEGLNDIGTHLVDLVQWTLFPGKEINYQTDITLVAAQRWPTMIAEPDFKRVTNEPRFPASLAKSIKDGKLEYFCNTLVSYTLRGVHTKLNVIWDWEAPPGAGDTHDAYYTGSKARIEVRQTKADGYKPELYIVPVSGASKAQVRAAVQTKIASLRNQYPGIGVEERGTDIHVTIPDALREGHEAHFAQVATLFFKYLRSRGTLPAWERPNMLAKYFVTTQGTALSRKSPVAVAPRIAPK